MPHPENIEPHKYQVGDERAVENGRKAAAASVEARRKKASMRMALDVLLEKDYNIKDPDDAAKRKDVSGAEALALVMMGKALRGDPKAWELVRDTAGQKPIERMVIADVDAETLAEVERMVEGIEEE